MIVDIHGFGNRGFGIARERGKVIFVPLSAPGDKVEIRIKASHKNYDLGEIVRILRPSPLRKDPPCPYFGRCGGCHLQHLDLSSQREIKYELFREALVHKGGVPLDSIGSMIFAPEDLQYRSRLEMHVGWGKRPFLGFMARGSEEIIPVERCLLGVPSIQQAMIQIQHLLEEAKAQEIKRIEISSDIPENRISILLLAHARLSPNSIKAVKRLAPRLSSIRGIYHSNRKGDRFDVIWEEDGDVRGVLYSVPSPMGGEEIELQVWPGVFMQANPYANRILVMTATVWIKELQPESILDLYSGMGNLTIPLSHLTREIVGVEVNPISWENAKINGEKLRLKNVEWIRASAKKGIKGLVMKKRCFDLVVLDPPRGGAVDILDEILIINPETILYISCDPATLSRDLGYLLENGNYCVDRTYPLDMFPQTYHLESITLLKRRSGH